MTISVVTSAQVTNPKNLARTVFKQTRETTIKAGITKAVTTVVEIKMESAEEPVINIKY